MAKQAGEITRKTKSGSVGSFFFGWFIGFLLTIALIGGLGAFIYFKVSISWVNNTFNQEIDLGSEELNNLTLNTFVSHAINLGQNIDTYTLSDLENDFGINIGDEIMGINILDLKSVPITELPDAFQNKLSNISAYELRNVLDLTDLDNILSKENTYYYNSLDNKLYEDELFTSEVTFDYAIAYEIVTIKGQNFGVVDGTVTIELRYLPLTLAMSSFTSDLGDNITLGELRHDYGVQLPEFLDGVSDDTTISELGDAIDNLYIADFLDYTIAGENVFDSTGLPVNGIMETLAKMQVSNLSNLKQEIDNMYIADILGYNYDETLDGVTDSEGEPVNGILNVISKSKVSELNATLETLTIGDLFDSSEFESGALSLISPETEIDEIPTALSNALTTSTLDELISAQIISAPTNYTNENKVKYIPIRQDGGGQTIYKQVQNLLLEDLIKIAFESIDFDALQPTLPEQGITA